MTANAKSTKTSEKAGTLRIQPSIKIGLAIWLGYTILVLLIQLASGVNYDKWGDSGSNLFFGAGVSLIVATILLAVTTTFLGWWKPVLFEKQKSKHRWPIVLPGVMAGIAVLNLLLTNWSSFDVPFLAASVVLLLVGFTEEMTARGLLLTGLRSRLSEGKVWFITSALFGLMHGINILLGATIAETVPQILAAFLGGTIFYIFRRTTGSLIYPMILHGVWDFSIFAISYGTISEIANNISALTNVLYLLIGFAALATVRAVIRDARESRPLAISESSRVSEIAARTLIK